MSKGKEDTFSLDFDPGDLSLGEMEQIEEFMGCAYDEVFTASEDENGEAVAVKLNAKQMVCLAYIAGNRRDKNFTWDDARAVKVRLLSQDAAPKDAAAPQEPGD